MATRSPASDATSVPRGRVIYNLDCSAFFECMASFEGRLGPVAPETINRFVDEHAALGITDLLINVNAQRTNYRSSVWDAEWDGYDPKAGNDQPLFQGIKPKRRFGPDAYDGQMYVYMYTFHKQGWDYPKLMVDRARKNHISPWISLRMNDDHNTDSPTHPSHSTFWRSHPEWRLPYGLDYEQPEVREHYLKLVREVCDRYDLDGLELDYQRFWLYFRPGREHEGAKLMTAFIEQVRTVTQAAAKRWGHPVKVAVRVPSTPWIARRHGLDAIAWAKAGLVDLIVASSFWDSVNSDIPIETWKGLLAGTDVKVALGLEDGIDSGGKGPRQITSEEFHGMLLSGLHRGADAVYFFNLFLAPYESWPRPVYHGLVRNAGSYEALSKLSRRHPITIVSPWAEGEPGPSRQLPTNATRASFRIHIGPAPSSGQKAFVEIECEGDVGSVRATLNDIECAPDGGEGKRRIYLAPQSAVSAGYNLVTIQSDNKVTLQWVEIAVRESKGRS
jgi:hypothetical protein